ncbi:MAG: nuclear transport factor 2 family protein [Pseudomonadota bacterium]
MTLKLRGLIPDARDPIGGMINDSSNREILERYVALFESLSLENVTDLAELCREDVLFKDPFNHIQGAAAFVGVMRQALEDLHEPRFHVSDVAFSEKAEENRLCYLRWTMTFRFRPSGSEKRIEGMSELHFAADGRVQSHIDHWDAARQFYEDLPMLGALIRLVRRRLTFKG